MKNWKIEGFDNKFPDPSLLHLFHMSVKKEKGSIHPVGLFLGEIRGVGEGGPGRGGQKMIFY